MFIKKDNLYRLIDAEEDSLLLKKLNPGTYNLKIHRSFFGTSFSFEETTIYDKGSIVRHGIYDEIWNKVELFISPEMAEARSLMNNMNKMGLLFAGKPGTGKTYLAGQIGKFVRDKVKESITVIVNSWDNIGDIPNLVDEIRKFAADQMLVLIFDEFEKVDRGSFSNSNFLSFLDGSTSRDKVLLIATVNDKSKLPNTLLERPGRFEMVVEFKTNTEVVYKGILKNLFPESYYTEAVVEELYKKVKSFKGECTIDHMRIMVRDTLVNILRQKNGLQKVESPTVEDLANKFNSSNRVGFKQEEKGVVEFAEVG
jgi:SpoVK/Ycf46/Vps4 family AAA+-type ATPase